jgi:hypothetical protein
MDRRLVSRAGDQSVKCINFANEMAFAQATDRWIARHGTDCVTLETHQGDTRAHARSHSRCLNTGMAATNYKNIKIGLCSAGHYRSA